MTVIARVTDLVETSLARDEAAPLERIDDVVHQGQARGLLRESDQQREGLLHAS